MKSPHYTPTERRMMTILADGKGHTPEELHGCLMDDLGPVRNIRAHLSSLRQKLVPLRQDIACWRIKKQSYYALTSFRPPPLLA